ncbi:antibiotic biosynthesis monooxygenase [Marinomonas pollencensis]|uniref:Antibiotic biosynthesis monooxygenase n=2 Tax=Marinomonas pollencensis TaxID=491954 RepID=A0A3E0DGW0_9GAMM|nr:antibiotic biosynthesis monooxygenase [Marinomonas pollencensis]
MAHLLREYEWIMINITKDTLSITAELLIKDAVALDQGLLAIQQFCADMNSESGCYMAVAHQDRSEPRKVILWEMYRDQAAFDAHFNEEHTQVFIREGLTELVKATQSQPMAETFKGVQL